MMTELLFRADPYLAAADCHIIGHTPEGALIVDRSVFYPTGGGQPGASGFLDWGGGRVRIGGDRLGQGDLPRAQRVSVDNASVIRADATTRGNGGDIVLWSEGRTDFAGSISARRPEKLSAVTRPLATRSASMVSTWVFSSPTPATMSSKKDAPCSRR